MKKVFLGKMVVSEVLIFRFIGNLFIFIVYFFKDGDKIIGILVGSINFNKILEYVVKVKIGKIGYVYMIDRNGLFVYYLDKDKILKENVSDNVNDDLKVIIN